MGPSSQAGDVGLVLACGHLQLVAGSAVSTVDLVDPDVSWVRGRWILDLLPNAGPFAGQRDRSAGIFDTGGVLGGLVGGFITRDTTV